MSDSKENTPKKFEGIDIQCLLRRKGGTQVTFGNNVATQTTYHFKPIDPEVDQSPHVCNVENKEHVSRLLSITESYRIYDGDDSPVVSIPTKVSDASDEDPFANKFDDILSIDFEGIENKTVSDWAKEVLGFTNAQAAQVKKKAAELDIKVTSADTMTGLLRKIGEAMQEEERTASEQAKK